MAELLNLPIDGSILCHAWNKDKTRKICFLHIKNHDYYHSFLQLFKK